MTTVTEGNNITDIVLNRWSAVPDSRLRQIMRSLIVHLHFFRWRPTLEAAIAEAEVI
jgi:hydroxyquinol 1,2-dioxygenase